MVGAAPLVHFNAGRWRAVGPNAALVAVQLLANMVTAAAGCVPPVWKAVFPEPLAHQLLIPAGERAPKTCWFAQ